ncbi:MAG: hypothetical protein IJW21_02795 [Clostridia bacterium]|nr:hypothetical protein [Clostridia bacterium]
MEENEIITEAAIAAEPPEAEAPAEETPAEEAEAEGENAEEAPREENAQALEADITAESFAKTLANPMFAVFARGRSGGIEEAVRDFEKMMAAGRGAVSEEDLMKMTPDSAFLAPGGSALSERQRKIARDAGMSYREYYEIIRAIPTKTK